MNRVKAYEGLLYELGKDFRGYYRRRYQVDGLTATPGEKERIGASAFTQAQMDDPRNPRREDYGSEGWAYIYEPPAAERNDYDTALEAGERIGMTLPLLDALAYAEAAHGGY